MNIRLAHKSDVAALVALYAPYVENTAMTFECQLSSTEEFANRIEKTLGNYFDLVVEEAVELSVYVADENRGREIGKQLYDKLEEILEQQGFVHFLACIALLNDASIKTWLLASGSFSQNWLQIWSMAR